jgi:hypothetical protein
VNNTVNQQADLEKVTATVQKLLNLAAKNSNEHEAAAATARAMEMLAAYNLDLSTLEQGGQANGKREDARVRGGMYTYERELWSGIAAINFCMYFPLKRVTYLKDANGSWIYNRSGSDAKRKIAFEHKIIGRTVNTAGTRAMGTYIQGTIERLVQERFPVNSQRFTSEAVAYREGMAEAVMDKLRKRRRAQQAEQDEAAERERVARDRAARAGVSTSTTLTIRDVIKSEHEANYDFLHGDGAWAEKEERARRWEEGWEKRQALAAAAAKEAEAAHARWAAANPEEAAAEEKKRLAKQRAAERRASRSGGGRWRARAETPAERRQGSNYFYEGKDRGQSISIDPQAGKTAEPRRLR